MVTQQATPAGPGPAESEYDVVIVGSGAGGLTAAITAAKNGLSAVVIEKAPHYGGSTARSGGAVWIPNNSVLKKAKADNDPAAARQYLDSIVGDIVPSERIEAFLEHGPTMLDMVLESTPLKLTWIKGYSDYYPEAPGGKASGRSLEAKPFDARILGADRKLLEPDYGKSPMGMVVTSADYKWLNLLLRHPKGPVRAMRVGGRMIWGRVTKRRMLGRGQALAAGLRAGVKNVGVEVSLNTPMTDLYAEGDVVRGVYVSTDSGVKLITARKGVLVTTGGFEHNAAMRTKYQRQPIGTDWTVGAVANTGDGIVAAEKLGAALELMDDAWWGPSIPLPKGPWFCLAERSLPGGIMINGDGQRFVNEAAPYVEATHAMYGGLYGQGDGPGENVPCWMIVDQRYKDRYMFAGMYPRAPFPGRWLKAGVIVKAGSIGELAEQIGIPAATLDATVQRFNGFAATGVDEDFGRGKSKYDNYYGDPTNKPNPNLGALAKAPYYAIKMVPGDLGTKGGIKTDPHGRALRDDGSVIEGLYAAGNASSPVMGHTYAGPGATIGPAMTFAYLAALHMAHAPARTPAGTSDATSSELREHQS